MRFTDQIVHGATTGVFGLNQGEGAFGEVGDMMLGMSHS